MPRPSDVRPARSRWSDNWIDETGPPASSLPSHPVGAPTPPSLPYLQARPARRPRTALLIGGLTIAVLLAATAVVSAIALTPDGVDSVTPVPGGPLVSIDQVFAPVPGYQFEESVPSAVAGLRSQLEAQPATKAITIAADGRRVMRNGQTVAVVSAVLFQEHVGASAGAAGSFLSAARSDLASPQDVTVAGRPAVSGQESDGIHVLIVYKNRVGLVVGGPADMAALEELTTRLLANVP